MVSSPQRWLPPACSHPPRLDFIHAESVKPPEISAIFAPSGRKQDWRLTRQRRYCLSLSSALQLDALMIMTSEPDGRGQQFIATMCEK
ncbi:hypothetical protein KCP78_06930 [Salmonella enterica subsp. enterica]|nr:hypothetical protein KCP78_06930 [Salmonella enterica subsp. enterica]